MAEENEMLPFSLDTDFDQLTDKDKTVELVGYVCSVETPSEVGKAVKYMLLKFSLSNDSSKKVQCLIWGQSLIDLYQPNIILNRIIHIDGAHCKTARLPQSLEGQGYVPFEIVLQASTVVKYLGMHESLVTTPAEDLPTEVTFEEIGRINGKISINGFIKTRFTSIPSRYESASYGCGSITDGTYKITVNISNYVPLDLEKGAAVNVIGVVDNTLNTPLIIKCTDSSCIRSRENVLAMPNTQLIRGVRSIKRQAP